jgi:hypothetical protein
MGMETAFEEMIEVAKRLGIVVRHVKLGGGGGGMAKVKGMRQLFIDLDADPEDQLEQTARALAGVTEMENIFVRADVRELLERYQRKM